MLFKLLMLGILLILVYNLVRIVRNESQRRKRKRIDLNSSKIQDAEFKDIEESDS